jgi:hypothetical protein
VVPVRACQVLANPVKLPQEAGPTIVHTSNEGIVNTGIRVDMVTSKFCPGRIITVTLSSRVHQCLQKKIPDSSGCSSVSESDHFHHLCDTVRLVKGHFRFAVGLSKQ